MKEQHIVKITTDDTQKTYVFGGDPLLNKQNPPLYKLEIRVCGNNGHGNFYAANQYSDAWLCVEEKTLIACGHFKAKDKPNTQPPTRTLEDVVLELLDMVGVRPQE